MSEIDIKPLLEDWAVARLLGYSCAAAFRRRRKALEAAGFPKRRPIVKRYSPAEVKAWVDGTEADPQHSERDPLLEMAGQWGTSK